MSTVLFKRGTTSDMNNTPITDGMLYFCTSDNRIYMDNGNTRLQYGGTVDIIQNISQTSNTNVFSGNAVKNLFLQKTTVVDTKANALAVTQSYIPLGCLAFKEAIGTTNYSNVGNGTISGGLVALRGETLSDTLNVGATLITLTSTIMNSNSLVDVYTSPTVAPESVTTNDANKTITLTFKEQESAVGIKVLVRNL